MLELAVAAALAGTLLAVGLQLMVTSVAGRRGIDRRACALVELGNVMERVAARPWSELTDAVLAGEQLTPLATRLLPGAKLKIEISAVQHDAKRIAASLAWADGGGQMTEPLRLVTWKYASPKQ